MRLLYKGKDGGNKSTVTGNWLFEFKSLFSISLLKFDLGSREEYHTHAFNAISWYILGHTEEHILNGNIIERKGLCLPKLTKRGCFHKIKALKPTWVLTIRGRWLDNWLEFNPRTQQYTQFTHGRTIIHITNEVPK